MSNTDPSPTWDDLKQLLRWFVTLFGEPKRLFEDQVVRKADGFVIRGWLAGLEAIARALLLAMAAALPRPETAPSPKPERKRPAARTARAPIGDDVVVGLFDAPDSERWADVRFVLAPRPPRPGRRSKSGNLPSSLIRTRPLAYRFEALLRVAERPERYAARLAGLLHADPELARRVLRPPQPIRCASFPRADVDSAQKQARLSAPAFRMRKPGSG